MNPMWSWLLHSCCICLERVSTKLLWYETPTSLHQTSLISDDEEYVTVEEVSVFLDAL